MKGGDIQHDVVVGWVTIDSIEGGGFSWEKIQKTLNKYHKLIKSSHWTYHWANQIAWWGGFRAPPSI